MVVPWMSKAEALRWLHTLKWLLADEGQTHLAGLVEVRVPRFTPEQLREWSYFLLPAGRRGRVHLVLSDAYGACATALLVGILRSVV